MALVGSGSIGKVIAATFDSLRLVDGHFSDVVDTVKAFDFIVTLVEINIFI
jgi:hypothetical protein